MQYNIYKMIIPSVYNHFFPILQVQQQERQMSTLAKEPDEIQHRRLKSRRKGWETYRYQQQTFTLPKTFKPKKIMGIGTYGIVIAARDLSKRQKQYVAIKKMYKCFDNPIYLKRTLRELKLLRLLKHQNIVSVKGVIQPISKQQLKEVYVVEELMETNLHHVIRNTPNLTTQHHRYFMYQLLKGIKYMHGCEVVHRDLKPRNILINSNCELKICDLGLSRLVVQKQLSHNLTSYVATRWYRAPQLLFGETNYTTAVDMWSVGCIFAQLITKEPILTGEDLRQQLKLICQFIGMPDFKEISLPFKIKALIKEFCSKNSLRIQKFTENFLPDQRDLLKKLLTFQPSKRLTAKQALKHPYFNGFHCEQEQPEGHKLNYLQFDFQNHNMNMEDLKSELFEEIQEQSTK